ncbi:uncharacterized protein LOC125514899 [Triticum urartu]|uniref:uncharacterized protein LOC125514899 n=1 Tax=Triticum urartu TaxID=4572 RepID=UPI0020442E03|nr:uncharacterized protein LOC125514899 [Triticum urartu]
MFRIPPVFSPNGRERERERPTRAAAGERERATERGRTRTMASIAVASALRRGAASLHASTALRGPAQLRGAAPPHGPGPHLPGPFRFGRPRHCIRGDSGPPTPDEEESQKLREKVESMDKEELQEYAKKVTGDLANLRQCNIDRAEMDAVKQDENLHHLTLAEDI